MAKHRMSPQDSTNTEDSPDAGVEEIPSPDLDIEEEPKPAKKGGKAPVRDQTRPLVADTNE